MPVLRNFMSGNSPSVRVSGEGEDATLQDLRHAKAAWMRVAGGEGSDQKCAYVDVQADVAVASNRAERDEAAIAGGVIRRGTPLRC